MTSVVGYLRVSTDEQSIDAQRDAISAWARGRGVTVAAWHQDVGVSGAAPLDRRPGLQSALDAIGPDTVLVAYRRDRIARDSLSALIIEREVTRRGGILTTLDSDGEGPEAELLSRILDGVAAYERSVLRSRTKAALDAKRRRGERTGSVPYGYRLEPDGVHVSVDHVEQTVIGLVRDLHHNQGLSLRAISRRLSELGYHSRRGRPFHPQSIARIIHNP